MVQGDLHRAHINDALVLLDRLYGLNSAKLRQVAEANFQLATSRNTKATVKVQATRNILAMASQCLARVQGQIPMELDPPAASAEPVPMPAGGALHGLRICRSG